MTLGDGDAPNASSLHQAASDGDEEYLQELLDAGADVDALDDEEWTALMWSLSASIAKKLIAAGADAHYVTSDGESVLMAISRRAEPEVVAVVIAAGVDVNSASTTGNVALGEAAASGNISTVRYLIEVGADVDAETLSGETPLWAAARNGHYQVVKLLLGAGATPNKSACIGPWAGRMAADVAAAGGHHEVASLLRS